MGRAAKLWLFFAALAAMPALAQGQVGVVRDDTLGSGRGEVVGLGTDPLGQPATYLITPEMGEQHGGNLFHSFERFDIGTGETATFTGPDPIGGPQSVSNVISRVTGGDASEIDGTLRSTIPGADLWLLNPSGVMFGEGATLDVPGSFHASTSDYLGFGEGDLVRFYSDPARPSVLATARPEAFGFLGEHAAAPITVTGATLETKRARDGLELVGGDVTLTGAELNAPGGTVSIRGGQIVVEQGSRVLAENSSEVPHDPGGSISVDAGESVLVDDSLLSVSTSSAGDAGTITVDADTITVDADKLSIGVRWGIHARSSGPGSPGRIEIGARSIELVNGGRIETDCFGCASKLPDPDRPEGAGTIRIAADDMIVRGVGTGDFADSRVEASSYFGDGDAGAVDLKVTHSLQLLEGGTIQAQANGITNPGATSNAGNLTIEAGSILISGAGQRASPSGIYAHAESTQGHAGTVTIRADSVSISEGGIIVVRSSSGAAGSITIDADAVSLTGGGNNVRERGSINAASFGSGAAGSITIEADSLVVSDQGLVRADTAGDGRGGSITVNARTVAIERQGILHAGSNRAAGEAGTIDVTASESILIDGKGDPLFSLFFVARALQLSVHPLITGVFSANGSGQIALHAPEITLTDGAMILATSVGGGDAGSVTLSGDRIAIRDGAFVDSTSIPEILPPASGGGRSAGGSAGSVELVANESIEIVGKRRGLNPLGEEVDHWSRVASASFGSDAAGTVTLDAPRIRIDGGAVATTALPYFLDFPESSPMGGAIVVRAGELLVSGGGHIDASSFVAGDGGSIDISASKSIVVEGEGSGITSRTGGAGNAGGIVLHDAPVIEVNEGGEVSVKSEKDPNSNDVTRIFRSFHDDPIGGIGVLPSEATGNAGSITLTGTDKVRLDGGTIAINSEKAHGGNVTIHAKDLVHLDTGVITASVTGGEGTTGGDIIIDPGVVILQNDSSIVATATGGSGGHISITADNYFAFPGSVVSASAGDPNLSGTVEVSAPDVDLAGQLTTLPSSYLDAASLMREACAARRSGERAGSFAVRGNDGIPAEPYGWLPASTPLDVARESAARTEQISLASAPRLALLGTCP